LAAKRGGATVDESGSGFWARFAVLTVVVLWISLIGGNWLGNYLMRTNVKFANAGEEDYRSMPNQRSRLRGRPPVVTAKPSPSGDDAAPAPSPAGDDEGSVGPARSAARPSPSPLAMVVPHEKPAGKPSPRKTAHPVAPRATPVRPTPAAPLASRPTPEEPAAAPAVSHPAPVKAAEPPAKKAAEPEAKEPAAARPSASTSERKAPGPPVPTPERPAAAPQAPVPTPAGGGNE
jgi:hypothetical protein